MTEYPSPVELVNEFHVTYGQPVRTVPELDVPEKAMRHLLIDEEIEELMSAYATYDFVEVIDALADIVYVVCGAGLTHGVRLNVLVERPLILGSFGQELLEVEPFTDVQRKLLAALWTEQEFDNETSILKQFEEFRFAVKSRSSSLATSNDATSADWDEINRKLTEREATVGAWFDDRIDNTVSILEQFASLNAGLHAAVNTDELRENWSGLVALSYATAFSYGVDLDVVLQEVQASNLSKLAADGSVLRREDGKVLKGPNFFAPNIVKVLEGQLKVAA